MMMVFLDPISDFINKHTEMKMRIALCFISVIGILLVLDSLGINSGIRGSRHAHGEAHGVLRHGVRLRARAHQMRWSSNYAKWEVAAGSTSANDGVGKAAMRRGFCRR